MPSGTRTKRTSRRDHRESVWSVNERWRQLYFTLFLLLMGAGSSQTARSRGEEFAEPPPSLRASETNGASRKNGA